MATFECMVALHHLILLQQKNSTAPQISKMKSGFIFPTLSSRMGN